MRIAFLECFSGMSGDMFLGALIDAGVSAERFEETVAALNIGAQLEISRVKRGGITAVKVDVLVGGEKELPREVFWEQQHKHEAHSHEGRGSHAEHSHGRGIEHGEGRSQAGAAGVAEQHEHKHGRGLKEIRDIISRAAITAGAKKTAIRVFEALGAAEAKIHGTAIDSIHFHEVGAADAMVDIVCAAAGAEELGVDEWVCSPLNVGGGTVTCSHGTIPIPAPATVELLKDAPVYSSGLNVELVTPTGAAIVKTLATRFGAFPEMKIEKSGYGAGTRDFSAHPNVVRLTMGEARSVVTAPHGTKKETITVLEANIDDLNPQVFAYVMEKLFEEGALDVFGTHLQMKKNRPGMLLTALCRNEDAARLAQLIFAETTTLGVRRREELRHILGRESITVPTRWGDVRLKIASMNGAIANYAPEYEDCRRIASEHHVPLKNVMQEAMQTF